MKLTLWPSVVLAAPDFSHRQYDDQQFAFQSGRAEASSYCLNSTASLGLQWQSFQICGNQLEVQVYPCGCLRRVAEAGREKQRMTDGLWQVSQKPVWASQ
jgi:hypothetical protein